MASALHVGYKGKVAFLFEGIRKGDEVLVNYLFDQGVFISKEYEYLAFLDGIRHLAIVRILVAKGYKMPRDMLHLAMSNEDAELISFCREQGYSPLDTNYDEMPLSKYRAFDDTGMPLVYTAPITPLMQLAMVASGSQNITQVLDKFQ